MDTTSIIAALRRWWWLVLAPALVGLLVGVVPAPDKVVSTSTTTWRASHTLLLSSTSAAQSVFADPLLVNQIQLFAVTGEVPKRVAELLNYDGEPAALAAEMTVEVDQSTAAVRLTTTQTDAARAVAMSDAFAEQLTTYLAEKQDKLRTDRLTDFLDQLDQLEDEITDLEATVASRPTDEVAKSQLDALGRQYSVLYESYRQLQSEQGQLQLTTQERAQAVAITTESGGISAPRSRGSRGILGAITGGLLGVGAALLVARSDRRVRTRKQVEDITGLRVRVSVPNDKEKPVGLIVLPERHDPVADSFRTLRSVVSLVEGGAAQAAARVPTIVVVSATAGDGKTTVASNLAASFVEAGTRTVAINADFRRPQLSERLLGRPVHPIGARIGDLYATPIESLLTRTGTYGLALFDLAGNRATPGDLARLVSQRLPEFEKLSAGAIVVDTSPMGATAEVLEILPKADVVVLVVRLDHSMLSVLRSTIESLRGTTHAPIVLVLTGQRLDTTDYYSYGAPATDGKKAVKVTAKPAAPASATPLSGD